MIYFSDCLHNIRHRHNSFCVHPLSFIVVELEWGERERVQNQFKSYLICMYVYLIHSLYVVCLSHVLMTGLLQLQHLNRNKMRESNTQ